MAEVVIKTTFQLKRGSKNAWAKANPTLQQGEPGLELDTNRMKIGDGLTPWNELEYFGGSVDMTQFYTKTEIDDKIAQIETGSQEWGTFI